jgi:hypothetical protein
MTTVDKVWYNDIIAYLQHFRRGGPKMDCTRGRPSRLGPEAEMVEAFVETDLPLARFAESRCILIEPHIEISRPDIVIVYWDPSITASWPTERLRVRPIDLRLAQLLFLRGPLREEEIRQLFPTGTRRLLKRLDDAGLVTCANGLWNLRDLEKVFAVRRIIAFEAKISAASRGLEQAYSNTWFASESYLLTASRRPSARIVARAWYLGIGVWSQPNGSAPTPFVDAKVREVPRSYASWIINELMWKISEEESI